MKLKNKKKQKYDRYYTKLSHLCIGYSCYFYDDTD